MGALDGKVAIVTGGTSGIGEGVAKAFVSEGAKVVIVGRREEEGRALEKQIGVRFVRADVANEADVKTMIDKTVEWFGHLDCLVNNAGIPSPMVSITETDATAIDQVLAVNVRGVILGAKHAASIMLRSGSGSIINIGSVAGHRGGLSAHVYSAAKGAVSAFTRSAAAELGEKGIRVNCISPGAIVTGIFGKNAGLEGAKADKVAGVVKEVFTAIQPIPRAGLPDDIAQAAVFLASDASGFVNGQDIVVDGGQTAVTRGWSSSVAGRAQLAKQLKAAAAALYKAVARRAFAGAGLRSPASYAT
jgi:NAD(P)-dependent dehydrogenase (short-subunit alcohol dehydrogenase family)